MTTYDHINELRAEIAASIDQAERRHRSRAGGSRDEACRRRSRIRGADQRRAAGLDLPDE